MPARRSAPLAALFPPGVEVFVLSELEPVPPLLPVEAEAVRRAVPKRQAEFARGRACARAALVALGLEPEAIAMAPDRTPIWPAGVIGSITHCDDYVAAAVARGVDFDAIGLDAEPRGALETDLTDRIATRDELRRAATDGLVPADELPRLLFSAKEVVHKCIHPLTGVTLDFLDVALVFDHASRAFRVEPVGAPAHSVEGLARIDGRYWFDRDHLFTAGALRRV